MNRKLSRNCHSEQREESLSPVPCRGNRDASLRSARQSWSAKRAALTLVLTLLAALLACTSKPPAPTTQLQAPATPIDPATTASISGIVTFTGPPPDLRAIDMSNDPGCHGQNRAETVLVNNGKLANVFVYVKEGLENRSFPVPTKPVTVEQTGCRYFPHVAALQTGQTLRFLNHDTTSHNIHGLARSNDDWNDFQSVGDPPLDRVFAKPEIMLPIKCNQHPWMTMYANIVPHPFFAVTAADGSYSIHGLPPGDYTLVFVHEKLGERTVKISLQPRQQATANATFQP